MTNDARPVGLLPREAPPTTPRIWRKRLGIIGGIVGGIFVGILMMTLTRRQQGAAQLPPPPPPPRYQLTGDPVNPMQRNLKTSYLGEDRTPKTSMVEKPQPPVGQTTLPPLFPEEAKEDTLPPLTQGQPASTTHQKQAQKTVVATTPSQRTQSAKKPPPDRKERAIFAEVKTGTAPFAVTTKGGTPPSAAWTPGEEKAAGGNLLRPAVWVKPMDPIHVIGWHQTIHGQIQDGVNSDSPGFFIVKVTQPLEDSFQTGVVLIPQHSLIRVKLDGKASYGQNRLDFYVDQIRFPDGTLMEVKSVKLADPSGAPGLPAQVDNHYVQLGVGVLISTALSVGARSVGGNGGGAYQADPALEASRNVAGAINQAGQDIVKRELMRAPTLTLTPGEAVTLRLAETVSLSKAPTLVR